MSLKPDALRILQVNSAFSGGGADKLTLDLASSLQELGEEVTLAVPAGSAWEPLARRHKLSVETFPERSPLRSALIRCLVRVLRNRRVQIIHAHQGRDYWPAIIAARLSGGVRVVITRHLMTRPRGFSRWFLLSSSHVVAVSKAVDRVLRRELHGPARRLHQVYNGFDWTGFQAERTPQVEAFRARQGWPSEAVVFGVVGAYHLPRGKGQVEFIQAAAQLKRAFPNARFAIVGSGTMESILREIIARYKVEDLLSMIPFTTEIPTVMSALDVLVHPAVGTEALPTVILEALASGRPVIASRLDGIPETFIENEHGLLVPPGEVAALTGAMRTLLEKPDLRRRLGAAGPVFVREKFSRWRLAEDMRRIYQGLAFPPKR